ncbi:hypothetical protein COP2_040315 [Malus domestica]
MNDYDHGILRIPMKRGSFILNFILNYELSYYIIIKRASLCERSRWSLSQLSPACYAPRLHAPLLALTMPRDLQTPVYISTKRRVGDQKVEAGFPLVLCMENFHSLPRQLKARGNNHLRVTELHCMRRRLRRHVRLEQDSGSGAHNIPSQQACQCSVSSSSWTMCHVSTN